MLYYSVFLFLSPVNKYLIYRNNPKYWDRQACSKNVDPDQTPQDVAFDQGLLFLPLTQEYFRLVNR